MEMRRRGFIIVHLALLGIIGIYTFYFTYIPYQDFPQWIYHGHVFNQMVFHHNNFGGFFWFHPYLPPNASATVLIGMFEIFASPILAGKLFLFFSCALVYWGSFSVLATITKSKHVMFALIGFSGCFSLYFYMGLMNFVFGLGIALLGSSYVLGKKDRANAWVMSGLFLLCYCSHFASLLVFLVPVLAVFLQNKSMAFARRIILAFLPCLVLGLHYYLTKEILTFSSSGILKASYFETVWGMIKFYPAIVMPFHRVKHVFEPSFAADIVNYSFAILLHIAPLVFVVRIIIRREKSIVATAGILTLILVIVSPEYLGGLFNLGERFVFLMWILLTAYFFGMFSKPSLRMLLTVFLFFHSIFTFGSIWYATDKFNKMDITANINVFSEYDFQGGSNPFTHFHFYDDIMQNRGVPVFHHALLDYRGAENSKPFDE